MANRTTRPALPGSSPISVPVPGTDLARRLDARRRAGLADPDWTMTTDERVDQMELLAAIRTALDDPSVRADKYGARSEAATHKAMLLHGAGLHPCDRPALLEELNRLVQALYGEQAPARLADELSLIDPHTRLFTQHRLLAASVVLAGCMAISAVTFASVIALLCAVALAGTLVGGATYHVVRDDLRLTARRLIPESDEVVAIEPGAASYSLARTMTRDVETIRAAPQDLNDDDRADLLAERDRIITELVDLDSRRSRLAAIEDETDESNADDHAQLVHEVEERHKQLARAASDIATRARSAREAIEQRKREQRQTRVRSELDDLADPPQGLIENPDWRESTTSRNSNEKGTRYDS